MGPNLVYTTDGQRKMNDIIENCDQDQFANGQSNGDLRVKSKVTEPSHQPAKATEQSPSAEPEEFPAPIGKLLGLKLLQAEEGIAVVDFVADERHQLLPRDFWLKRREASNGLARASLKSQIMTELGSRQRIWRIASPR